MGQLERMKIFVRVVESGSFTLAAQGLNMSKSMVSRRLSELETEVGSELLTRTTRTLTLTDVGRYYYQQSLGIIDEIERLNQRTANSQVAMAGPLVVGVPLSFGTLHLAAAVDDFIKAYPQVQLDIRLSDRQHQLVEQGIDMAVRISTLKDSTLRAHRLAPINFVVVASPDYLASHEPINEPAQLMDHQILHYSLQSHQRWQFSKHGQRYNVDYMPILRADNGEILRDLVIAGQGVALLPTFIAWQAILTGQLNVLLGDYSIEPLYAWLVYPQSRYQSYRLRTFMDFLIERFADNPYWDQMLRQAQGRETLDR